MGQSSFIHYAQKTHVIHENPKHKKAKERVKQLLCGQGFTIKEEYPYPLDIGELGERSYQLDIYAVKGLDKIDIEIDGKSHDGIGRAQKDGLRDIHIRMSGLRVVRFNKADVNGYYLPNRNWFVLTDKDILDKILAGM